MHLKKLLLASISIALLSSTAFAVQRISNQNGTFGNASVWNPTADNTYPVAGDTIFIRSGYTITLADGNDYSANYLYLANTATKGTLTITNGSLSMNGGGTVASAANNTYIGNLTGANATVNLGTNGTLNINHSGTTSYNSLWIGYGGAVSTININTGGNLSISSCMTYIGNGTGTTAIVNLIGGNYNTSGNTIISKDGGSATVNLSGGSYFSAATTIGNSTGTGNFSITGSNTTISAGALTLNTTGNLSFIFDASGVSQLGSTSLTLNSGFTLDIDGSAYTGGDISDLVDLLFGATTITGTSLLNAQIQAGIAANNLGFSSDYDLSFDGTTFSASLIPEPSTYAILAALATLALALNRRRNS